MALSETAKERLKTMILLVLWVTFVPVAGAATVAGYRWARAEIREWRLNTPLTTDERVSALEAQVAALQRSLDDAKGFSIQTALDLDKIKAKFKPVVPPRDLDGLVHDVWPNLTPEQAARARKALDPRTPFEESYRILGTL